MLPRALLAAALPLLFLPAAAQAESQPLDPPTPAVDLLVVIDSAPAMAEERAALAAQIDDFVDNLYWQFDAVPGYGLSLHVGIVTSDLGAGNATGYPGCVAGGDEGRMRADAAPGCQGPTGTFLRAETNEWGEVFNNFTGDVGDAVACMTPVTLDGCRFQQPLRAAITALDGSNPENAGFLRDDAILAVLFVSNQDDCSADADFYDPADTTLGAPSPYRCAQRGWSCTQALNGAEQIHTGCFARDDSSHFEAPAEIVDALAALKWDRSKIAIGVLRAPESPVQTVAGPVLGASCGVGTAVSGTPALRLDAVAAGFPERFTVGSICQDPLSMLVELAFTIRRAQDDNWDGGWDGGIPRDAGWNDTNDAGEDEVGVTGTNMGCGCAAQGGDGAPGTALLLLLVGAIVARWRGGRTSA